MDARNEINPLIVQSLMLNNQGVKLAQTGKLATGLALIRRAIMTNPIEPAWRCNLAAFLASSGEIAEATALVDGVLAQDAGNANAYSVKSVIAQLEGDLLQAIVYGEMACKLAPAHSQMRFDLATAYLRAGDFERGWPAYEVRAAIQEPYTPPPVPKWEGQKARHVFVYGEQGVGDKVQFARYLPLVKERALRVTFAVDPMSRPLFAPYASVCDVVDLSEVDMGLLDYQISLCSLPLVFKTTVDTIPPDPGLLTPPIEVNALAADGLRVGICWAGNSKHANDDWRSMPFTEIIALGGDPRNDLFSLQVGERSADISANRAQRLVTDLAGYIEGSWENAPRMIANLDVLVTVDTAIAHIAGAMGKPVFLLLSKLNDWRWLGGRSDSPWYPSVTIIRQDKLNDWRAVVRKAMGALNVYHNARFKAQMQARGGIQMDAEQ